MIQIQDKKNQPIYAGKEPDFEEPTRQGCGYYAIVSLEPCQKSRPIGFITKEQDDNIGNKVKQQLGFIRAENKIPDDLGNRIKPKTIGFKMR